MQGSLSGEVAIVTGASSGLGRRFANVLADAGAAVALVARRTDMLQSAVAEIRSRGRIATAVSLDVVDPRSICTALKQVQDELGSLSIIINNAGVGGDGAMLDMSVDTWDHVFAVNVRGVFLCAREAALLMIESGVAASGRARIVNIASIASSHCLSGLSAYCTSKAAVAMLTKCLAKEWSKHSIAVNAICPGYVETEINREWFASDAGKRQIARFPRRRLLPISSFDEALLFLVGASARHVTGTLVTIDDGQSQ